MRDGWKGRERESCVTVFRLKEMGRPPSLDSAPAKLLLSELEWWEKQERLVPGLPDRNLTKSAMARAEHFYLKGDRAAAAAELSGKNYLERAVSAFLDGKKFS